MRMFSTALLGVLFATAALAQPPAQPTTPPAPQPAAIDPANPLDRHLLRWEEVMSKMQTFFAESCTRVEISKVYKTRETFEGSLRFQKPNLFLIDMRKKTPPDKPMEWERVVSTGTYVYQYVPSTREIRVYRGLNAGQGRPDDNSLAFVFGMKAAEAKRRYEMQMTKGKENDPHYVYVDILPRFPNDKAEFQRAQLVLSKTTFLPAQLWFEQPNKDEVIWRFEKAPQVGVTFDKRDFSTPQVPKDWKMVDSQPPKPGTPQPRVIRPNG